MSCSNIPNEAPIPSTSYHASERTPLLSPSPISDSVIMPASISDAREAGDHDVPAAVPLHVIPVTNNGSTAGNRILGVIGLASAAVLSPFIGAYKAVKGIGNMTNTIPPPETINVNVEGHAVAFSTKGYPAIYSNEGEVAYFTNCIQQKITAGETLLNQVCTGHAPGRACTVKDMTDIMTYLQAKAEQKVGCFSDGAFSIPDPNNRLRDFFDTCPDSYQRLSSHIDEIQRTPDCKHRGIDANDNSPNYEATLPRGKATLLYGTIPQNTFINSVDASDRIFLKMEDHGCFVSMPKGGRDLGGPHRWMNMHDIGAAYGHLCGTIRSTVLGFAGLNSPEGSHKERIPPAIITGYKQLINDANNYEYILGNLTQGNPLSKSGGIHVMRQNLQNVRGSGLLDRPEVSEEYQQAANAFYDAYLSGSNGYDNPTERIGQEVIFTAQDLHLA